MGPHTRAITTLAAVAVIIRVPTTKAHGSPGIRSLQNIAGRPCGSTWLQELVIPQGFGRADFRPCCTTHDACYGTCGANKQACDTTLESCVQSACNVYSDGGPGSAAARQLCLASADAARAILSTSISQQAFSNAQTSSCSGQAQTSTSQGSTAAAAGAGTAGAAGAAAVQQPEQAQSGGQQQAPASGQAAAAGTQPAASQGQNGTSAVGAPAPIPPKPQSGSNGAGAVGPAVVMAFVQGAIAATLLLA